MTADKGNILLRYSIIIICILIVCIAILTRAGRTIFVEREEWQKKADSLKIENVTLYSNRGNIYTVA